MTRQHLTAARQYSVANGLALAVAGPAAAQHLERDTFYFTEKQP
ncbi:hypothetical protein USDA257_c21990 [Sinorhizobium fredii USDA 257]|uniref:Uncharacterized protein n=1 Tax=Sinorhizobium fredii (strain USDA 257) TaxID=1185652 RepID=I3X4H5_SINF2|nr:hypothetical protein USDA257_c21990 [Sinorhizobium fredii USDA 257]